MYRYVFFFQVPYVPELIFSWNDFKVFERLFSANSQQGMVSDNMTDKDVEAYKYAFSKPGKNTMNMFDGKFYQIQISKYFYGKFH